MAAHGGGGGNIGSAGVVFARTGNSPAIRNHEETATHIVA